MMISIDHKGCAGFTLLEVLVAAVVMSIGLLGLAGLQMTSLKNTHTASITSQAGLLAYSIADSIRTNPGEITDLKESWQAELSNTLPYGTGEIIENSSRCLVDNDNNGYLVKVEWDQDQDGNLDTPYEFCFYYEK